jgi:hypothetical protein
MADARPALRAVFIELLVEAHGGFQLHVHYSLPIRLAEPTRVIKEPLKPKVPTLAMNAT